MSTVVKRLGPEDHGQPMTFEEFVSADYQSGYHYELIDGRLYVSPEANFQEHFVEKWVYLKLEYYSARHPRVMNYVANKARVFIPGHTEPTAPEPDVAGYQDIPMDRAVVDLRWEEISPFLTVEVLTSDDAAKDLVRNVALYRQVPSIKEYWIIDAREDPARPTMLVYRKFRGRWRAPIELQPGDTYTTPLLPGFKLVIDPRR